MSSDDRRPSAGQQPQTALTLLTTGLANMEALLTSLDNKSSIQGDMIVELGKSFIGLEERLTRRLDNEKEYVQYELRVLRADLERQIKVTKDEMKSEVNHSQTDVKNEIFEAQQKTIRDLRADLDKKITVMGEEFRKGHDKAHERVRADLSRFGEQVVDAIHTASGDHGEDDGGVTSDDVRQAVLSSCDSIKAEINGLKDDVIQKVRDDVIDQVGGVKQEVSDFVKKDGQLTRNKLREVKQALAREMHADTDKQLQTLNGNLMSVMVKEAELSREVSRSRENGGQSRDHPADADKFDISPSLIGIVTGNSYKFKYTLKDFDARIGSGIKVFTGPCHITKIDLCFRLGISFTTSGLVDISMRYSHVPILSEAHQLPKRFYYRVFVAGKQVEKELKSDADVEFGVSQKKLKGGSPDFTGQEIGSFSCSEWKQEGLIVNNALTVWCEVTV